jgi:hypothetical protein
MLNIYLVKERVCALLKNRSLANLIKKKVQYSVENSFSKETCLFDVKQIKGFSCDICQDQKILQTKITAFHRLINLF